MTIKVLVVDDMPMIREILQKGLSMDPAIEVVGTAEDPYDARDKIIELRPDVMTLDVEMPRMNGVEFLKKLMPQFPVPTVMVSSLTERGKKITIDALEAGAVDFVAKPTAQGYRGLNIMIAELRHKVKIAAGSNVSHWKRKRSINKAKVSVKPLSGTKDKIIAIGASTGGTEAIREVITKFPADMPGVVIVQHMPAGFTKMFAERMNALCRMEVKEATHGDQIIPGRVLIAPGGLQMKVIRDRNNYKVDIREGELCCGHCPSVEIMMSSIAESAGDKAVGVMLTGMGSDGADAMKKMRDAGARTIAQNEESCIVFGMPKEAYRRGGAEKLIPLEEIASNIIDIL